MPEDPVNMAVVRLCFSWNDKDGTGPCGCMLPIRLPCGQDAKLLSSDEWPEPSNKSKTDTN